MSNSTEISLLSQQNELIERGRQALAEARSIGEVKGIRDKAASIALYLSRQKGGEAAAMDASELTLLAEIKLGELLASEGERRGGKSESKSRGGTSMPLPDGISRNQSSRWQKAASVPEKVRCQLIAAAREAKDRRKITTAAVITVAKATEKLKKEKLRERAAAAVRDSAPKPDVRHCSMQKLLATLHDIDAIITDPPYPEEFLPLYGELAQLAKASLKPDGILAVMCGQSYLPRIIADMTAYMPYRWTFAYLTPGGQAVQLWQRKINTFWKPVLVFGGTASWAGDVIRSDVNDNDKRYHGWGQSESGMGRLVNALTEPGQIVCDPFIGGGTTGVVCTLLGRRFIGCDVDAKCVKDATTRMKACASR